MKKSIILGILYLGLIVYNNYSFNQNIQDGKDSILNKKYVEAKELFEKATEEIR